MAHEEERSWLDEAFDEKKTAQEIERAKRSRRIGYILLAAFVVLIVVFAVSCTGMIGVLGS